MRTGCVSGSSRSARRRRIDRISSMCDELDMSAGLEVGRHGSPAYTVFRPRWPRRRRRPSRLMLGCTIAVVLTSRLAFAEGIPLLPFEDFAWRASDVVVASAALEDRASIRVCECWKGNLKPGEVLKVPFLELFCDPDQRVVTWLGPGVRRPIHEVIHVTGTRMILFLRKGDSPGDWRPADRNAERPTLAWVESGSVYAPYRAAGYSDTKGNFAVVESVVPYNRKLSESDLKERIGCTVELRKRFEVASSIADVGSRAQALDRLVAQDARPALEDCLAALRGCAGAGASILRQILKDESREE